VSGTDAPIGPALLLDHRLVDEAARQAMDRARDRETLALHHADERKVIDRIDPEPGAGDPEPAEGPVGY